MPSNSKSRAKTKAEKTARGPTYLNFDKTTYAWRADIDYREQPEMYRVGRGEQGVLICEPYKSELVRHWRFKTPDEALQSSKIIYGMFHEFLRHEDFVGADMARKYLQMGFTSEKQKLLKITAS